MSNSQFHGKAFEREVIETCFGVAGEEIDSWSPSAPFDIPLGVTTCKHPDGDPVSIKTAALKAARTHVAVCLSDARRVWAWQGRVILIVGVYRQKGSRKEFHTIYEFRFKLDAAERERLYGTVTQDEVEAFHEGLKLFPRGQHSQARKWAKEQKALLTPRTGAIQLNPKIDSKTQRRLQCSAWLSNLQVACGDWSAASDNYRGLPLPYVVESSSRKFSKARKPAVAQDASQALADESTSTSADAVTPQPSND